MATKKKLGGAREGAGRKPRGFPVTRKNLYIPDDVMKLYTEKCDKTGRSVNAELLTAVRRHVGLE